MSNTAPVISELLSAWTAEHRNDLIELRRDLHAHPELSGEEHRTTDVVAAQLTGAGYEVRRLSSGTGLIADSRWPSAGEHRLAIRADLDALAMVDLKDIPYRSTVDGVAHACGHDVHTTIAVGTARFFSEHHELAAGSLRFIFQPAEERVPGGALDVLADDGLGGVDAVVGLHCEPKLDCGVVGLRAGSISSAADMVTITLHGPGGHTARPELTVDLVDLGARLVTELPARMQDRFGHDVKLVFGAIHSGDAANVIPTACELRASVRTPSFDTWDRLEQSVTEVVAEIVDGTGASHVLDYIRGVPPTVNDAGVIERVSRAAGTIDDVSIVEAMQSWGGDDFAWLARVVPGAYVRLGVRRPGGATLDLHAGQFDVDERAIDVGIQLMVATAATR